MNKELLNEALKIIKEPITVNSIEYKYFNQENYEKLLSVYENAKWFVSNWEQVLQNIKDLQQKVKQLESIINEAKDECKSVIDDSEHTTVSEFDINGLMITILKILNKGDNNE